MDTTSLPQTRDSANPQAGVVGPAERRSCDQGDGHTARQHGQPEGRRLPPALEPPPRFLPHDYGTTIELQLTPRPARAGADARTPEPGRGFASDSPSGTAPLADCRSGCAGAPSPGLPGPTPKGAAPVLDTFPGKSLRSPGEVAPRGQRALDLTGAQLGLDGRSYAPTPHPAWEDWLDSAPAPWEDGEDLAEPEPAPTTGQQVFGPLEPWVTGQPLLPLFTTSWERDNPKGYAVSMEGSEWREAASECMAHAVACLRKFPVLHPWKEKKKTGKQRKTTKSTLPVGLRLIKYLERGAREILDCDSMWRMPVAECGAVDEAHALLIDGCDCKLCQRCQNLRANTLGAAGALWAKSHPVMRWRKDKKHAHGMSRDYYTGDHTLPKSPTFTVLQLRDEVQQLQRFRYEAFHQVFRMLPRKKTGRYGEYPGICDEAGMVGSIEFGPHMNPHAHYARYGAHHWSPDARQATGGYWGKDLGVRDNRGRQGREAVAGAFAETLKYPFMMSNKRGRNEYLHPWYATLIAIATFYKHLVQGYGTMAGLVKQAEDTLLAARQGVVPQPAEVEHDVVRDLERTPCCKCGCNAPGHWRYKNVKHDTGLGAFMRRRMEREQEARPPPGGS